MFLDRGGDSLGANLLQLALQQCFLGDGTGNQRLEPETVLSLVGSKSKIVFRPLPSDDPRQRQPDISLAKDKLGWEPKVALKDGLKETIAYFRGSLS